MIALVAAGQHGDCFPCIWTSLVQPMERRCEKNQCPLLDVFLNKLLLIIFPGADEYDYLSFCLQITL